ncbi:MAG: O-antigen ligase family protein [Eubacteriales bacterium]
MEETDLFEKTLMASGFLVPLMFAQLKIGVFTVSVTELMVALIVIGFLLRIKRGTVSLRPTAADKIYLILVLWAVLSLPRAIDLVKSLREMVWLMESAMVFYMVGHGIKGNDSIIRLLKAWCFGAFTVAMLGIVQYCLLVRTGASNIRISSTLPSVNSLAGYLVLFLPILVGFTYGSRGFQRFYWVILAAVTSTALILTYTRGAWVATAVSLMILTIFMKDKRLFFIMIAGFLIYDFVFPDIINRVTSILAPYRDYSISYRFQLWKVGLKMWQEHPLNGVGIGNYLHLYDGYLQRSPEPNYVFDAREPHSSFIKFLSEMGTVGLVLFLSLLAAIFRQTIGLYRHFKHTGLYPLLAGITCGGLGFLLQSNSNSLFHDPRVSLGFWLAAGLVTSAATSCPVTDSPSIPPTAIHPETVRWLKPG